MRNFIKKILPVKLLEYLRRYYLLKKIILFYRYDCRVFYNDALNRETELALKSKIIECYHIIEKGLTMPDMRLGFGRDKIINLINLLNKYVSLYNNSDSQLIHAVDVVAQYRLCHDIHEFRLDKELLCKIETLMTRFPDIKPDKIQIEISRDEYFDKAEKDFREFSKGRRSIRDFSSEPVDINSIYSAVEIAQSYPSSCNRQPVRVTIISNKEKIKDVLSIQGGNRGFGDKIDKLIVITSYLGIYGLKERNCCYIDGGIFLMNLLYGLFYNHVASCTLNWSVFPDKDLEIRKLLHIPDSEVIVGIVACGNIPEKLKIVSSPRYKCFDIISEI